MSTTLIIWLCIAAALVLLARWFLRRIKAGDQARRAITDAIPTIVDRETLRIAFEKLGLEAYLPAAERVVRDQVGLITLPQPIGELAVGASRIGGVPDLPASLEWPLSTHGHPLAFLAQVNLREASPFDRSGLLPKTGWLWFYFGTSESDFDFHHVQYFDGSAEALQRRAVPDAIPERIRFRSCAVRFDSRVSLPLVWEYKEKFELPLEGGDLLWDPLMRDISGNKLLGWADSIQGPAEEDASLTGRADQPNTQKEMRLLFQVDSEDKKTGMTWGDAGMVYFLISEDDLKAQRFDKTAAAVQCY